MDKLIRKAVILSFITIFYNIVEGVISVYFGAGDETLALLGFGVDSFVEVISGIGILWSASASRLVDGYILL